MILRVLLCALAASAACLGCGGDTAASRVSMKSAPDARSFSQPAASEVNAFRQDAAPKQQDQAAAKPAQAIDQKIIYTGQLSVVAKDFDKAEPKVREVVKKHKGYIADAQVQRNQGSRPSATWVVRTPAENFDDCLHDLAGLGVPESQRISTQDVGEEYVDVQSRVASKKKVEERILEMLKDRKGDLKEVMELEAKLAAVREEIERAQGRLNFLTNRVAYSTINLTLREERDYVPPQTPDFAGQVADVWKTSTGSFIKFLQAIALFGVGVAPWLPVWLILGIAGWIVAKRIHRTTAPRPT
jgi:uncharacterized small protein (DUF1192 family)